METDLELMKNEYIATTVDGKEGWQVVVTVATMSEED